MIWRTEEDVLITKDVSLSNQKAIEFGTRYDGDKDAARAHCIQTRLSRFARLIYHDALLEYLSEDGKEIEPKWYIPVISMVLVNGAEGIGNRVEYQYP